MPKVEEFERYLNKWRELYVLDDLVYHEVVEKLRGSLVSPEVARSHLIRFLEIWGVRGAMLKIEDHEELSRKINGLRPEIEGLKPLLEIDLDEHADTIKHIFREISSVKGVGPTSASKLLHMLKPETFVMWDERIADKYDVPKTKDGYLEFLRKMKGLLTGLIREYSRKHEWANPPKELFKRYKKPVTKLVDEYNWLKTRPEKVKRKLGLPMPR